MTINDIINDPEGAENSSLQDQREAMQNAKSYEFYLNSFYVAAIAASLGCVGLSPAFTATKDGIDYNFDFYHLESKTYFKVFKDGNLQEYSKYAKLSCNRIIIVDAGYVAGTLGYHKKKVGSLLILPKGIGNELCKDRRTLLYSNYGLWEPFDDTAEEWCEWRLIKPTALTPTGFSGRKRSHLSMESTSRHRGPAPH